MVIVTSRSTGNITTGGSIATVWGMNVSPAAIIVTAVIAAPTATTRRG